MDVKSSYMVLGGTALIFSAIGSISGYFFAVKRLTSHYEEINRKDLAEAKLFYSALHKKEKFKSPEETVENLGLQKAAKALQSYQQTDSEIIEEVEKEMAERSGPPVLVDDPTDAFDYEEELKHRSIDTPYVISYEEYMENDPEYIQVTLTFFEGDDILSDEHDKPVDDVDEYVGETNLLRFGHGSQDPNIVYIRNEKLDLDFEVARSDGSYAKEVQGLGDFDG